MTKCDKPLVPKSDKPPVPAQMKKTVIEFIVILAVSMFTASLFNFFSDNGISPFKKYIPKSLDNEKTGSDNNFIETIDIEVFRYMKEKKDTVVLDARSRTKYREGHIPGSFSFPLEDFDKLFFERGSFLKAGKTVITYCSGPSCSDSLKLAVKLKKMGVMDVLRYSGGLEDWIQNGNEVTR